MGNINHDLSLLRKVFSSFRPDEAAEFEMMGNGNINKTYRVTADSGNFVMQQLNTDVFKDPEAVINNLELLMNDPELIPLVPGYYRTVQGTCFADNGGYFKLSEFVPNTFQRKKNLPEAAIREAAYGYGKFYSRLNQSDISLFRDTIPDFHHFSDRADQFTAACREGDRTRIQLAAGNIDFLQEQIGNVVNISRLIEDGQLPLNLAHNDAKFDNILLNREGSEFLFVIDLDTVMPGSFLYDFGDFVRSVITETGELDRYTRTDRVILGNFKACVEGFCRSGIEIDDEEKELLYDAVIYMVTIQALRFTTDFLMKDQYFRVHHWDDNLIRSGNQVALLKDLKKHESDMKNYLAKAL